MKEIDIFRNGVKVCALPITENNASYTKRLMAEENIVIEYSTADIMPIKPLDYILYKGVKYTLWTTPIPKIGDGDVADYSLVFFAPYYILYHKKFKHIGADSNLTDAFSYSGYTSDFAQLIINTINDIDAGWSIGEIENLGFKTIEFNDNSCYTALTKICEAYECEFDFNNKILTIKKSIGNQTDHTFSYGKGKGLYELTVQELSNSSIITKLEVFGGTTNMNKGTRLKLAAPLEKNIDKYGIREDKVIFEHIFPRLKEKTITGVTVPSDIANAKKWEINLDITFDLSKCVIAGLTPQLQFQSGELKGITFDLASISENNTGIDWNNTTKHCYIITKTDGTYKSPSATRQPKVGDKFVLLNVSMDQSYIEDALAELDVEGRKYHDTVCVPQLAYSLNIDPRYIKTHSTSINIGDKITVLDSKRSVNDKVRVTIKKYPLSNPNNLDLTISSEVLYESSEKVQVQIDKNSQITAIHDDDIRRQYLELKRIDKEAERIKDSLGPVLSRLSYDEKNNSLVSSVAFASAESVVMFGTEGSTEGGGGGVMEHNQLFNRDFADQHPISSITGLTATLDCKASTSHTHNYLSAITKDMVEQVLTGDIASHTHNKYALLNGSETEDFNIKTLTASGVGYFKSGLVLFGTEGGAGGGGSGTLYHDQLENRNIANQHTISAITDLQTMLDSRVLNSDARLSNARPANGGIAAFTSIDNDIVFGRNTLQFAQTYINGTGLNGQNISNPTNAWYSHIIMNHDNTQGYYQQLSFSFGGDDIYLRRLEQGTLKNWRRIALSGESQPASDVYQWAKAANKPIYSINELLQGDTITVYMGALPTGTSGSAYTGKGGWYEDISGASVGYFSLYSGGSASSILLKHNYYNNDIYFKKSIDSNRWLSDWNFFWTSANLNRPIDTDDSRSLNNVSGARNKIWFDYNFAGTGALGSVISFSGLGGGYSVELMGGYGASKLLFRTRNGDNGNYNSVHEIYSTGNANLVSIDWSCRNSYINHNSYIGISPIYPHYAGKWMVINGKSEGVRAGIELHGQGSEGQFTVLQQVDGTTYLTNDKYVNGVLTPAGGAIRLISSGVYFPKEQNNHIGVGITPMIDNALAVCGRTAIGQFTNGTSVIDAYNGYAFYGCNEPYIGIRIDRYGNTSITGTVVMFSTN